MASTVALPPPLVPILDEHLAKFSAPGRDGLVVCGPKGGMMRRGNFSAKWTRAVRAMSVAMKKYSLAAR